MLKALGNRIIVKPQENAEETSGSGLIITKVKDTRYSDIGEVMNVSRIVGNFKVGDMVLLPHFGLNAIEIEKVRYYAIYADDILGKIG